MHWSTKYNDTYGPRLLALSREGKSITQVCCDLEISRETYYRWRKEHSEFNEVASLGEQLSQSWWEEKGKDAIFSENPDLKFAASSWQFVLKNRFRDSYSDQAPKDSKDSLIEQLINKLPG